MWIMVVIEWHKVI